MQIRDRLWGINRRIYSGCYGEFWGWHDDHRDVDRTPEYKPALMQVKSEFEAFAKVCADHIGGRTTHCLQLGMGATRASHEVWMQLFDHVVTIDLGSCAINGTQSSGMDTHSLKAWRWAKAGADFDVLFIDAGHSFEDVKQDHEDYAPLVRPGGIVAFHDAIMRPEFPEVGVNKYLISLPLQHYPLINWIGDQVGIAWYFV